MYLMKCLHFGESSTNAITFDDINVQVKYMLETSLKETP